MTDRWLLPAATAGVLAAPLLGQGFGTSFFLCELLSHFPVQYAVGAGLLAAFWLGKRQWTMALLALLAVGINGYLGAGPLLVTPPPPVPNHSVDLRVFQANVLYTRTDYQPLIDTLRRLRPDFFVLQEMTPEGYRAVQPLRDLYPYMDSVWAKGPCYIVVGSRTPFRTDSAARATHQVLFLTSVVRGRSVSLITVHPRTPLLPTWFAQRNRQLAFVAGQLARLSRPAVLIGDFNTSIFSPVYDREFTDRHPSFPPIQACRSPFGLAPTWPRFFPLLYIPIDHAFVNHGYQTVDFRTLPTPDSDHRAICVDLVYQSNRINQPLVKVVNQPENVMAKSALDKVEEEYKDQSVGGGGNGTAHGSTGTGGSSTSHKSSKKSKGTSSAGSSSGGTKGGHSN